MDDLDFGTPRAPQTPTEEAWHREQHRKQYDIIRVANPIKGTIRGIEYDFPNEDYYIQYDVNQFQKIPANSTRDVPRNRAELYVSHMKDTWVNFVTQKMHDDFIADRDRRGLPRYTDKATENAETYETQSYPKTNDESVIAEIYNQLWVGLVNKAGSDVPPELGPRAGEVDQTPTAQRILESLSNKIVSDTPPTVTEVTPPSVSPFATINRSLSAEEVTND